jgi:hypothetical protein
MVLHNAQCTIKCIKLEIMDESRPVISPFEVSRFCDRNMFRIKGTVILFLDQRYLFESKLILLD